MPEQEPSEEEISWSRQGGLVIVRLQGVERERLSQWILAHRRSGMTFDEWAKGVLDEASKIVSDGSDKRKHEDEPRQVTRGLLDALVLTLVDEPEGGAPKIMDVEVLGLPGFRATLKVAAVQELRRALDIILGPQAAPDLAGMLRRYFEIYDRPCQPDGNWPHVEEYRALEGELRRLVGAPSRRA